MTVEQSPFTSSNPEADEPAQAARRLMRTAVKGALATLDHETGHPYASLVLVATEPDGTPVLLLSTLARHTQNLGKDPRASLLLDGTGGPRRAPDGGPADADRRGSVPAAAPPPCAASSRAIPRRATMRDSAISRSTTLEVAGGHFIGGFGRIVRSEAPALLTTDARMPKP